MKALPLRLIRFIRAHVPRRVDPLIVATAEGILSTVVDHPIQLTQVEFISERGRRNLLLRCHCPSDTGLPPSLIIKKVKANSYNPDNLNSWDTLRFFRDWIGAQFLSTLSDQYQHSPRFYGGDRTLGFIILEDVPHHARLVESLLGGDRHQAERALLQYAACLAQLHVDTLGKAAEFEALAREIVPKAQFMRESVDIPQQQRLLNRLEIQPESSWLHDLNMIDEAMNHPGNFLAYVHADACPDNVLDTGEGLRLIDFETGHFGHAFIDIAYGRMMFPSCWCANRLPHTVVQQMENAYRAILIQQCPSVESDSIFETALVRACGYWMLNTLTRHLESALRKDLNWRISTTRQRILARLEAFITIAQEFNQLPGLRGTAIRLLDLLQPRWRGTPSLPDYPAFR
ncbi:MAG: phosphotransferase [Oscillatoriophycideae cyanobacterium NC_groundwater_1537_Pr4_S-0.65um_50_18]|nr:phosphotransferase [Oscillatoriophycideae cyanobacterium NC_groundwater_1537_Pr4_S-0.65um_50_18]